MIKTGNFNREHLDHRGWVVGNFVEKNSPFCIKDFEVKRGKHDKGAFKDKPTKADEKTLEIMIRGKFIVKFPELKREIILEKEGEYLYYDKGTLHNWEALEDSLIIVIRRPSI